VVDRLRSLRGAGESYSDVILRVVEQEGWRKMDTTGWRKAN
jgi:hypothetical protein